MINDALFNAQKSGLIVLVMVVVFTFSVLLQPKGRFSKDSLLIDINKADFKTLDSVPYIGKKTAKRILKLRKDLGYFKDVNQLKKLRNFKKFKYYLKVE